MMTKNTDDNEVSYDDCSNDWWNMADYDNNDDDGNIDSDSADNDARHRSQSVMPGGGGSLNPLSRR